MSERLGVSRKVANFSLPVCCGTMNGCAAFIFTTVLFVSESNGYTFAFYDYIIWIFLAVAAAVGNASVPMGCYFMSTAYLVTMGVPLDIMGLILPIYSIIDMVETAINVWSDVCVTQVTCKDLEDDLP